MNKDRMKRMFGDDWEEVPKPIVVSTSNVVILSETEMTMEVILKDNPFSDGPIIGEED